MTLPASKSIPPAKPGVRMPDKIGKYAVIKEVGRGSTGVVYLSHDAYYGRDVAIKVYNMDTGGDEERARIARKMFLSEAHLVGMLQHPHILPIYDAGEENGHCYIVTEHVHGARTLAAYCRPDNLLRIDDTVEIMFKCAKALHYAHSRGVIHRDIKPSNVMLTQDSDVRIIDFGIALVQDSDISRIEGIAGSPSYMSPEQVQSLDLTNSSDLYSLGAVMYELLTGQRPFRAGNLQKLLHQIVYATPPPIHTLRKDVPEELEAVVATALLRIRPSATRAVSTSPPSSPACISGCARPTRASTARSSSACCGA
jgi:serine/threonine protein kinase